MKLNIPDLVTCAKQYFKMDKNRVKNKKNGFVRGFVLGCMHMRNYYEGTLHGKKSSDSVQIVDYVPTGICEETEDN